jgi:hypothetical protein
MAEYQPSPELIAKTDRVIERLLEARFPGTTWRTEQAPPDGGDLAEAAAAAGKVGAGGVAGDPDADA